MAAGTYTALQIRDELFSRIFFERLTQNANVFNAATRNGFRLQTQEMAGHYAKTRVFDRLTGTSVRRDISSVATVNDSPITTDELVSVKLNRKFGPYAMTRDSWKKAGQSEALFTVMLAQNFADDQLTEYVNTGLKALRIALTDIGTTAYTDYSGTGDLDHTALINGLKLFGDAGSQIVCWLGHSKSGYDLLGNSVGATGGTLAPFAVFEERAGTFNRPFVQTDSSSLIWTGTPDDYATFGLVEGSIMVTVSETPEFVTELVTGHENLFVRVQGEHAYNLELKSMAWDTSAGGINPTDAAIGTSDNWDFKAADVKNGPGVYIRTQ